MSTMATTELQQLLTFPPPNYNGQANNSHAIAHAVLESLRDAGDPNFLFIRTILEQPPSEELLFHCITGCRHVVLTRWHSYSESFSTTLRDLFMCLGNLHSSKIIRMACYTTSVAFWKRKWCDDSSPDIPSCSQRQPTQVSDAEQIIIDQVGQIQRLQSKSDLFIFLHSQMQTNTINSCQFLSSLIGEFSGKSVVPYRLPMEFHKCAYRLFENENLEDCLKISMEALSHIVANMGDEDVAASVVTVTIDVLSWEFGGAEWMHLPSSSVLIRPPERWSQYLIRPDFIGAMFAMHEDYKHKSRLAHCIRQLLLLLCSLTGPIFREKSERQQFANFLCEGTHNLLHLFQDYPESSLINDAYTLIARLVSNFSLSMLSELPSFIPLMQSIAASAAKLLDDNQCECEEAAGDFESMQNREWREEALALLLQDIVLLCKDPWLHDKRANEASRRDAQIKLMQTIGGLHPQFARCRMKMAYLSEHYAISNNLQVEETDEDIVAAELDDELAAVACIGRLHLTSSLSTMTSLFQEVLPRLRTAWQENANNTPDSSALLKETSLLIKYLGHLLTDEIKTTDSVCRIPHSIDAACGWDDQLINEVATVIRGVLSLMEAHASSVAKCPTNPRLSPSLAKDFVWFLKQWVPAYVCSADSENSSALSMFWSNQDAAHHVIEFCLWLCQQYFCYWYHIETINESATELFIELSKCNPTFRSIIIHSNSFGEFYKTECLVLGLRHEMTRNEIEIELSGRPNIPVSMEMIHSFFSLPSETKAGIMAAMLISSGDPMESSRNAFNGCLQAVHESCTYAMGFTPADSGTPARKMIAGSIDMLRGVVYAASTISEPERIPHFITPLLPRLSSLMDHYSEDISICEGLLCLFRDYAESCALHMSPDERLGLFEGSSNLLKKYSVHHCTARVIKARSGQEQEADEDEQTYSDILCALELLINLSNTIDDTHSTNATDVVFYGLQQIVPLMTQGLLSYPSLCTKYFALVSYMMEKHPSRVTFFPFELLDALLQSLLYGSTHHDSTVAKKCLDGLAGVAKAHLQSEIIRCHFEHQPDLLDKCTKHLFMEVIFQQLVWDRLDETSNALLVLLAADTGRLGTIVQELEEKTSPNADQQNRLHRAFEKLIQQDLISGALLEGYEGRSIRRRFKDELEAYTNEVHSFLLVK